MEGMNVDKHMGQLNEACLINKKKIYHGYTFAVKCHELTHLHLPP